jgi:hypothetical protein
MTCQSPSRGIIIVSADRQSYYEGGLFKHERNGIIFLVDEDDHRPDPFTEIAKMAATVCQDFKVLAEECVRVNSGNEFIERKMNKNKPRWQR